MEIDRYQNIAIYKIGILLSYTLSIIQAYGYSLYYSYIPCLVLYPIDRGYSANNRVIYLLYNLISGF
jgi:hypothetical protein